MLNKQVNDSVFSAIYIEEEVSDYPRVKQILERFPDIPHVSCGRYGEIFNRNSQNFRLQKRAPALILAKKYGKMVLPAPEGYGFKGGKTFYFSHMLNCVYDCRYCFLQGMYRSANYVLFVNYEDFEAALRETMQGCPGASTFYSGYDCDSLALEPVSDFCKFFLPTFAENPRGILELRTKSTQIRSLLEAPPLANCVVAMSFTSHEAYHQWEHKVPAIGKRIEALQKLQQAGWPVALRFEPLIADLAMVDHYQRLFEEVFAALNIAAIHSVSIGEFRMPSDFMKNIVKLYPDEALFARPTQAREGLMWLKQSESESIPQIEDLLMGFISREQYYRCTI
ncbi:MAG: DNA photolyase [Gammaproteobacteria bacterium]|nr:DNA photolyase [Gammaproteobacteria bacterium]MDP6732494.1 DNA photolyase [Gammaproteobacteria bacterium]